MRGRGSARLARGAFVTVWAALSMMVSIVSTSAPAPAQAQAEVPPGTLISATPIVEMDADEVVRYLALGKLDPSRVRFGVQAYQIVYQTVDPDGLPTTASGLVALPDNDERDLRLVTWLHGTTVYKGDVASMNQDSPDRTVAFAFAAAGYAVSAPDYLGLGLGPGPHPNGALRSIVTDAVDALRATHALAERQGRRLDERVFVTGASQGGISAMALGKSLHEAADPQLQLGALAPISGPYQFSATLRAAVSGAINASAALAYVVVGLNRLYDLYATPGEAFRPPFDTIVERLIDGDHTLAEVLVALPPPLTAQELFTPQFLALLQHPTGMLEQELREADSTCDWRPDVPVLLYASSGDRIVPIFNARYCEQVLRARGADVQVIDVGDVDHRQSAVLSLPRILTQFEEIDG